MYTISMYKRPSKHHCRNKTFELMKEQLFCILYPALYRISKEYDELVPAEVWHEAMKDATRLKQVHRPDMVRKEWEEMLLEEYLRFDTDDGIVERSEEQARRSAFVVMMTMLYILATENKNLPGKPYEKHCLMLAEATARHELCEPFKKEVYSIEEEEELNGRRVEMVNTELEAVADNESQARAQVIDEWVGHALKYGDKRALESHIIVMGELNHQHAGEFIRQERRLRDALEKEIKERSSIMIEQAHDVIAGGGIKNIENIYKSTKS